MSPNEKSDNKILNIEQDLEELIQRLDTPQTEQIIKEFYSTVAKFNNYSFNNIWLLQNQATQRGMNLTSVASFKDWSEMEVSVKKGRKALKVFAPKQNYKIQRDSENRPIKINGKYKYILDENKQKIKTDLSFFLVPVFDASQTNAVELGKLKSLEYRNQDETISDEMLKELYKEVQSKFQLSLEERNLNDTALGGFYQKSKKHIVINSHPSKSNNSKVGTLFHELGHHLLHNNEDYKRIHLDTGQKEGERESVAFIISKYLGVEQKSELYLKSWERDAKNMKDHLERIVRVSKHIIKTMDFETTFKNELHREELTKGYLDTLVQEPKVPTPKQKVQYANTSMGM
jgi:Zn-dependent peptidase ImmA (M78 family)